MFDSTIRLKQINNPEISGYILTVVGNPLTGTGILTGVYYPLNLNPSGYITSGQTGILISSSVAQTAINSSATQTLIYVSNNYAQLNGNNLLSGTNTFANTITINGSNKINFTNGTSISSGVLTGGIWNAQGLQIQGNSVVTSNQTGLFPTLNSPNIFVGYPNYFNGLISYDNIYLSGASVNSANTSLIVGNANGETFSFTAGIPNNNESGFSICKITGYNYGTPNPIQFDTPLLSIVNGLADFKLNNIASSGYLVVTTNQTGQFYASSNPLGFITTGQTGNFAGNTGQLIGIFAQLNANNLFTDNNTFQENINITGSSQINFTNGTFIAGTLTDTYGFTSVDWANKQLINSTDGVIIDWQNFIINDSNNLCIDWSNRRLVNQSNVITIDWQNQVLTGTWNTQGLAVNGVPVVTDNQTGLFYPASNPNQFITHSQTGILSNVFYPLILNPANYITSSQTGTFITTNNTGQFTGIFALNTNLQTTGSILQTEINTINNSTGNFITNSQTGIFPTLSSSNTFVGYPNHFDGVVSYDNIYISGVSVNSANTSLIVGNSAGETFSFTAGIPDVAESGFSICKITGYAYGSSNAIQFDNPIFSIYNGLANFYSNNIVSNGYLVVTTNQTGNFPTLNAPNIFTNTNTVSGGQLVVALDSSQLSPPQLIIEGISNNNQALIIGYNTTSDYGSIQAVKQNVAYKPLLLNVGGGNVGVNNLNPSYNLDVSGSGNFSSSLKVNGNNVLSNYNYRAGTVAIGSSSTTQIVSFSSNFTGTNYSVSLTPDSAMASANSLAATSKTVSGFTISATLGVVGGYNIDWNAWIYN